MYRFWIALTVLIPLFIGISTQAKSQPEFKDIVFWRNHIEFTKGRQSAGASASLFILKGKVYVLTAKHLLGSSMSIEPSVLPSQFDKELRNWLLISNQTMYNGLKDGDRIIPAKKIYRPNDNWDDDILILEADIKPEHVINNTLPLSEKPPKFGDKIYFIGCPYAQEGNCEQNIYTGIVNAPIRELRFSISIEPSNRNNINFSGFSGAPILNEKGEVIGVLTGLSRSGVIAHYLPQWLIDHN